MTFGALYVNVCEGVKLSTILFFFGENKKNLRTSFCGGERVPPTLDMAQ